MSKEAIHIQSEESREAVINQFCKLIAGSSLFSVVIYLFLQIYILAIASAAIGSLFLLFYFLNKKQKFHISRAAIIFTSNLGLVAFSWLLGFHTGIYFYLFIAPLLTYLLYDFHEKRRIYLVFGSFLLSFMIMYFVQDYPSFLKDQLSPFAIKLVYAFNFASAFIITFGMVTLFANNNNKYIDHLRHQQDLLVKEVALRKNGQDLLQKSLAERELLLSEVHHRVKNNLAIISALINLQIDKLQEESSKQIFKETKNRIFSMSLIHNLLYQNHNFAKVNFAEYIDQFCKSVSDSYYSDQSIELKQEVETIEMDIKTAIPLALILNELLTNSYKHAFVGRPEGLIHIELKRTDNNRFRFRVSDNGIGMDPDFMKEENNSMGMEIVRSLIEQLDAELDYQRNEGSHFTLNLYQ